jgi:hypothetical protein
MFISATAQRTQKLHRERKARTLPTEAKMTTDTNFNRFLVGEKKKLKQRSSLHLVTLFALLSTTIACSVLVEARPITRISENKNQGRQSSNTSAGVNQNNEPSVNTVAREIESCFPWSELRESDDGARQQIMTCIEQIANYDLAMIRLAMEKYVALKRSQKAFNVAAMSRLYVLNRYLFNVPDKARFEKGTLGGWMGVPADSEWINPLWPFTVDEAGTLTLTGQFRGYLGDDYLALQEFDDFNRRYGVRKKPKKEPKFKP